MPRRRTQDSITKAAGKFFTTHSAWLCVPIAVSVFLLATVLGLLVYSFLLPGKDHTKTASLFGLFGALYVLAIGLKAGIQKVSRGELYDRQTSIESIRELSWSAFEVLVGEAYRRQGYQVTETGGGGPDGGIDLVLRREAETAVVQCKQWKVFTVGVKPIREVFGVTVAEKADQAIFVTSGVYTKEAKSFATGKPIELIDGEILAKMVLPIQETQPQATTDPEQKAFSVPSCPKCSNKMVKRTAKRGAKAGSDFWGCNNYPACRGTLPLE